MLKAKRRTIPAAFFPVAEIDAEKVGELVSHLQRGGAVPPVVVALYGDKAMPLDGHHRMQAHRLLGRLVDAWVVDGRAFDDLCTKHRRAEDYILCDGVPAMQVAALSPGQQVPVQQKRRAG
jgi:ParB-like chromosome segregation protein Spo0J